MNEPNFNRQPEETSVLEMEQTGKPKRAAIYARTATVKKEHEHNSLAGQIDGCTEYIMKQGYLLSQDHIYEEVFTGLQYEDRPAFTRLREAMKRHEIDVVIVYTLDRIARNMALVEAFIAEAESFGIKIESALEPHLDSSFVTMFLHKSRKQEN
jgi:site-specific DNA recombinase